VRVLVCLFLLATSPAYAQPGDGVYGRFDGDLTLEAGIGGGIVEGVDNPVTGAGTLDLRARYLDVAGLAIGAELRAEGAHRVWIGVDFRPVFLARFLLGGSFRDRWADLIVDSIGFDLGVAIVPLDENVGAALAFGWGIDIPLVFFNEGISGLALRFAGRYVGALEADLYGPDGGVSDVIGLVALVIRGSVATGLPTWGPRPYELP
jgi:hypothetical protein